MDLMRKPTFLFALLAFSLNTADADTKIIRHETVGNLQSTQEIGCIALGKVTNTMTPADLYRGMAECMKIGNLKSAADLFMAAGVYGRFDSLRVADPTAPQGITVLQMQYLDGQTPEKKAALNAEVMKLAKENLAITCKTVQHIGPPSYHPSYMIQHGMRAFEGEQPNKGLKPEVKSLDIWNQALDSYLHCPH